MGDMADMLIEQGLNNMIDGLDDEPQTRACKYCDERDLHWDKLLATWRLFDHAGNLHSCQAYSDGAYEDFMDRGPTK